MAVADEIPHTDLQPTPPRRECWGEPLAAAALVVSLIALLHALA